MPSCWNGRRCPVILCLSSLPLPSISAFICSPVCPERLAPADTLPGFPAGWLLLDWLMGDTSRKWGFGRWKVGEFPPSPSCSMPHDSDWRSPSPHGRWFILAGPFSPRGRETRLLVSGRLTIHCCFLNSVHVSGSNVHWEPSFVPPLQPAGSLADSPVPLHWPPCFPLWEPAPWWLLPTPCICYWNLVNRLFFLNLLWTHRSSLANRGYCGSFRHSDPHWISSTSFMPSFWLKLWTAQHLFLTPWHSQNSLTSAWRVLSSTYPTCSLFLSAHQ